MAKRIFLVIFQIIIMEEMIMEENFNPVQTKDISGTEVYSKTFLGMFLGVLATAIVSVFTYITGFAENYIELWPALAVTEFVLVLVLSLLNNKLSVSLATVFFFVYAILNGITLSLIFYAYNLSSIITVFFATSAIFGISTFVGITTKKDLSKFGTMLITTLFVGIIISIINIFLKIPIIETAIDWIMLLTFFGVTIYDVQKIKASIQINGEVGDKSAIFYALQLYLDFVNIFIRLLSLFGSRRR